MALTITSELTVITSAESADAANWSDVTGGGASIQETDFAVQGSECRSRAISGAAASRGMIYDNGANLDFSVSGAAEDMLIYIWIATFSPGLIDDVATAPGLRIRIDTAVTAGTDYWEWDIQYSDLLDQESSDFFRVYVLDPRAPPTRTNGTPSLATVRHVGAVMDTNANSKGQNLAIDRIAYGFGELVVTGTPDTPEGGFQEIIDDQWGDSSNRDGIIIERGRGVAEIKGKLVFGDDAGTLSTAFTGEDTLFYWADTLYYDGTRVRTTVGYDSSGNWTGRKSDGTAYYGIDFRGNGTGDTDVTFGVAVGTDRGRSGPTFKGSLTTPTEMVGDDAAVEDVALYGATFEDFRAVDMSGNASTDVVRSCVFKRCGAVDLGPVEYRNCDFIAGLGGAYTFLERFLNSEASAAEALSTADPVTEWTDVLNGSNLSVPSADAGYVEVLDPGVSDRREVTVLDDDKMGSDDHYAECIVRFPSGGANQSELGPVIRSEAASEDYYYLQVDLLNDTVTLISCNGGTDTTIAGPTAFTMDEDEDYLVHLRAVGTTIEGFISGNSVADGFHTTKVSATNSDHSGTTHRRVGIRADAEADQTGDAPRLRLFGAGPVTDNLGQVIFPSAATDDIQDCNFIQGARALSWDTTGTYSALTGLSLLDNLVAAHNDSGGLVTASFVGGTGVPANTELLGAATVSFSADVNLTITCLDETTGQPVEGVQVAIHRTDTEAELMNEDTNASGVATETFNYSADTAIRIDVRKSDDAPRYVPAVRTGTIINTGFSLQIDLTPDSIIT